MYKALGIADLTILGYNLPLEVYLDPSDPNVLGELKNLSKKKAKGHTKRCVGICKVTIVKEIIENHELNKAVQALETVLRGKLVNVWYPDEKNPHLPFGGYPFDVEIHTTDLASLKWFVKYGFEWVEEAKVTTLEVKNIVGGQLGFHGLFESVGLDPSVDMGDEWSAASCSGIDGPEDDPSLWTGDADEWDDIVSWDSESEGLEPLIQKLKETFVNNPPGAVDIPPLLSVEEVKKEMANLAKEFGPIEVGDVAKAEELTEILSNYIKSQGYVVDEVTYELNQPDPLPEDASELEKKAYRILYEDKE